MYVEDQRIVIKLDGVKIEKQNIQKIVNWPVPRRMNNIQKF